MRVRTTITCHAVRAPRAGAPTHTPLASHATQRGNAGFRRGAGRRDGQMPRNTLRAVAVQLQAGSVPAAQAPEQQAPQARAPPTAGKKDSKGRAALPSVPYTDELPGAREVEVSAEEVTFFKQNGFLVKRGLIDGEELYAVCLASLLRL